MSLPTDLAGWMPTGPNPVVDACVDERLVSVFFGGDGYGICRDECIFFSVSPMDGLIPR